jgi:hypothetical protein
MIENLHITILTINMELILLNCIEYISGKQKVALKSKKGKQKTIVCPVFAMTVQKRIIASMIIILKNVLIIRR